MKTVTLAARISAERTGEVTMRRRVNTKTNRLPKMAKVRSVHLDRQILFFSFTHISDRKNFDILNNLDGGRS